MDNVFMTKTADVQLSNGRTMPLEDLVRDYEGLLKEKVQQKVGVWFLIDREVIVKNKEEICRQCNEAGTKGKELGERFEVSNEIADKNPDQYPRLIMTYIYPFMSYQKEWAMRELCQNIGDGMCDEVICDLELQMRICNGEPVDDLVNKADKLPYARLIQCRDGVYGYFGGGTKCERYHFPPANLIKDDYSCLLDDMCRPYAFRRVRPEDYFAS